MVGCLLCNFNFVSYRLSRLQKFYRSNGLKSQLVTLENGSTMHCWVPKEQTSAQQHQQQQEAPPKQENGVKRGWKAQAQALRSRKQQHHRPVHDKPALVLIHGFGGNGTIGWEHQIAGLTKNYRVYVPDLIFFGSSTTTNPQRTEIFQADCVKEMLTKLNVEETHVVGTSYGGKVAFWMAYKYPRFCQKVVISSCGVCMTPTTNDTLLRECNLSHISEILLPSTIDGLKLSLSVLYVKPPPLPDFIAQQILDVFYSPEDRPHRLELVNAIVLGSDKCPPLPVLTQEVLIVWGRQDQLFELSLARKLQQHLGANNAQVVVIEAAGHMPQEEKPKEYTAIIKEFLDDSAPHDAY